MDDRRRSTRHEVNQGVTGKVGASLEVKVLNISENGILVESMIGLPPAGVCELTVAAPGGDRLIRARVARCRAKMVKGANGKTKMVFLAGLEFFEEDADGLDVHELISEICVLKAPADLPGHGLNGIENAM